MGAASTPSRICPECGTPNSGISLFCSECGASLTSGLNHSSDQTDNQATAAFRPVSERTAENDPYATQQFRVASASSPHSTAAEVAAPNAAWMTSSPDQGGILEPQESSRGLVLGWIAAVLILLVIGYLGWTSFLDPGTRDSIIGIFN